MAVHPSENILIEHLGLGTPGGISVAVKDCIDIAGRQTRCGSGTLADIPAAINHADAITAILNNGGWIVGKANMHELAYGVTGINRSYGTPVNPLYPELIPGGSSSGSAAAVAAGLADVAIGTDTGGSIRQPAACCGVFGFKPTFGRVSRAGCAPAQSSLDCVGPFARNLDGIVAAMELIDPSFEKVPAPAGLRVGLVTTYADLRIDAAVRDALAAVDTTAVELPLMEQAFHAGMTIIASECWAAFGCLTEDDRMGDDVRARLLAARDVTAEQVEAAETIRAAFRAQVDTALTQVHVLALPTLPVLPPGLDELGDAATILQLTKLVRPFNLSGHPALTIPLTAIDGRPVSLQLVGRTNADEELCAAAGAVLDVIDAR